MQTNPSDLSVKVTPKDYTLTLTRTRPEPIDPQLVKSAMDKLANCTLDPVRHGKESRALRSYIIDLEAKVKRLLGQVQGQQQIMLRCNCGVCNPHEENGSAK